MAQTPAERMRAHRARKGAKTRTAVEPCGGRAAVARHQRNPDKWGPLADCEPCSTYESNRQAGYRESRRRRSES
jgi:hypothetical protein